MQSLGRRRLLRVAAAVGLVALAGCEALGLGQRGDRVRLAISPGNQTLWRFLEARNDNLLRPKGYVVEFENVENEEALRDGLVGGQYDAIATLIPALPQIAEAGTALQFFLPIGWIREGYPLAVPASSSIRGVTDLAGKRVATYPLSHPGFAYWRAFLLKHYGMRAEQLSTQQTLSPQEALTTRQVDAAFVSGSGWAILQDTGGFKKVADLQGEFKWLTGSDRVPIFAGFMAKKSWLDGHERFVGDLIAAVRQGLDLYKREPSSFLDVVTAEPTWAQLSRNENASIATYLGYDAVTSDRVYLTPEDIDDVKKFFPLMADAGLIKAPPADPAALFYLPKRG